MPQGAISSTEIGFGFLIQLPNLAFSRQRLPHFLPVSDFQGLCHRGVEMQTRPSVAALDRPILPVAISEESLLETVADEDAANGLINQKA